MKDFDLITFDCYGTLIDWEAGISEAFRKEAAKDGIDLKHKEVVAAYATAEAEVEGKEFVPYHRVLCEAAHCCAPTLGWELTEQRAAFLVRSLPAWQPFPDTNPALERLASHFHLGILSNVDDELLVETLRHFTVSFEMIVTAEQVRSYKPRAAHFKEAMSRKGTARWLHAGQSWFHDIQPALELGVPVTWINRKSKPMPGGERKPRYIVNDLTGLADLLGA
ncbi:MAG: HAD-IA family hydrolase [Deltaproteobacteria bacterium]|nr:HAD-IA family hydrolase [Deltaproteobacteria bacterium]MCZ6906356.1 HAD-IA family hydrolase [Deltaproteobacteria bacterium]